MLKLLEVVWVRDKLITRDVSAVALAVEVLGHESVPLLFEVPYPTLGDICIVTWHKDLIIRRGPDLELIYILFDDKHLFECRLSALYLDQVRGEGAIRAVAEVCVGLVATAVLFSDLGLDSSNICLVVQIDELSLVLDGLNHFLDLGLLQLMMRDGLL